MRIARYLPRLICNVLIIFFQLKISCRFLNRFLLIAGFLCIHNQLPGKNNNTTPYSGFNNYKSSIFHKDQLPLVFTGEPVDITTNSAVIAGKVVAKSDDITDKGFCLGTEVNPYENISNKKSIIGASLLGQVFLEKSLSGSDEIISTENLPHGIYLVTVIDNNGYSQVR